MNILVVDDDPIIRKGINRTVNHSYPEHELFEAASASEALKIMEADSMSIVLTDITMPGMDGLTFIENYRNQFSDTKWVVISALSDYEHLRRALKLGVKDYLLKPFDKALLSEVLGGLIDSMVRAEQRTYTGNSHE